MNKNTTLWIYSFVTVFVILAVCLVPIVLFGQPGAIALLCVVGITMFAGLLKLAVFNDD